MSMFDNYKDLNPSYIPNNKNEVIICEKEIQSQKLPHCEYNIKGKFIAYSWNYGDTLVLDFKKDKTIFVEKDAIIFEEKDKKPDTTTEGTYQQKIYNTIDFKCWICLSKDSLDYVWEEIPFTIPILGEKEEQLKFPYTINNGKISITIYDFRNEQFETFDYDDSDEISFEITEELSQKLLPNVYKIVARLYNDDNSYIFNQKICLVR